MSRNTSVVNVILSDLICGMIQRKEQEQLQLKRSSGDGSKHVASSSDDTAMNLSSSIPSGCTATDDVMSNYRPAMNMNGRTLIHRHGLANGIPAQAE